MGKLTEETTIEIQKLILAWLRREYPGYGNFGVMRLKIAQDYEENKVSLDDIDGVAVNLEVEDYVRFLHREGNSEFRKLNPPLTITPKGLEKLAALEGNQLFGSMQKEMASTFEKLQKDLEDKSKKFENDMKALDENNKEEFSKLYAKIIEIMGIFVTIFSLIAIGGTTAVNLPDNLTPQDLAIRVGIIFVGLFLTVAGLVLVLERTVLRKREKPTGLHIQESSSSNLSQRRIEFLAFLPVFASIYVSLYFGIKEGYPSDLFAVTIVSVIFAAIITGIGYWLYTLFFHRAKAKGIKENLTGLGIGDHPPEKSS